MPIDKIRFEKLFPTVQYGNELFVMECSLGPGETVEGLYDMMSQIAVAQFARNNPNMAAYQNTVTISQSPEPEVLPVTVVEKARSLEDDVRSCSEITVLKSYELLVKSNPILKNAYDETMDKLLTSKIITNGK